MTKNLTIFGHFDGKLVDLIFGRFWSALAVWRRLLGQNRPKIGQKSAGPKIGQNGHFGRLAAIFWRKLPNFGQSNFADKLSAKLAGSIGTKTSQNRPKPALRAPFLDQNQPKPPKRWERERRRLVCLVTSRPKPNQKPAQTGRSKGNCLVTYRVFLRTLAALRA